MTVTTPGPLAGKVALVTGGARRVGAAIAGTLHAAGATLAIHYRNSSAEADAQVERLNGARPESAAAFGGDLIEAGQPEALVAAVADWGGRLDVLVNNASTFYPTPLGSITETDWTDLTGSNLKAPLFLSQAAAPHLRAANGSIVNLVDIHARRPLKHHLVYGAAKAGLVMLTRALSRELAPEVRVNGVAPGAIAWPENGMTEEIKDQIIAEIPLGRSGKPEDVARTVLFLVADAGYVTGQVLAVDGGRSTGW